MEESTLQQNPEPVLTLQPVEEILKEWGEQYPQLSVHYTAVAARDLHLAEIYRQVVMGELESLNPVQAVLEDGIVWVDILAELAPGATVNELAGVAEIRGAIQTSPHDEKYGVNSISSPADSIRHFVSGRVNALQLPELLPFTSRLKAARPVGPELYNSVPAIEADKATLSALDFPANITGQGVIIGVVDMGCDFNHPYFHRPDNSSRILFLWDQNGTTGPPPAPYNYGREYTQAELTNVIQAGGNVYDALKYTPKDRAHGTHVMDISAGSAPDYPGIAPDADLIFVHLGLPAPIVIEEQSLGSTSRLYEAVEYIFNKADAQSQALGRPVPVVVNISLATNGGPHDGTTLVEEMFDALLSQKPGRAIVVAAGNSFHHNIHTASHVAPGSHTDIEWFIESLAPQNWGQRQELEIWYHPQDEFEVEIFAPDDTLLGSCGLSETKWATAAGTTTTVLRILHKPPDPAPGEDENHINIFIDNRFPQLLLGAWRFRLRRKTQPANGNGDYHAWIERDDNYPSHFSPGSSQTATTLNSIGNASLPLVVGSYNARLQNFPISYFSSAGPSRNLGQPQKPEVSAPGDLIYAARATNIGRTTLSGTSMAAPHVTGVIALLFQAALDRDGKVLSMTDIRNLIINTADHNQPGAGGLVHDTRYGFGRVNARKALEAL